MAQWIDIARKNNARGIDSYSPRGNIGEGYAENLANVDTNANGKLSTRAGYQGYAGWVPLRATRVTHVGTDILIQFDSSQDLSLESAGYGPLVIAGKVPSIDAPGGGYAGDFSETFSAHYYSSYFLSNKDNLAVGANTIVKTQDQTGITNSNLFVGMAVLTGDGLNNSTIDLDNVAVDETSFDVTLDATATVSEVGAFFYKECPASVGETYIEAITAQTSVTITAGTHALTNFNILVRCWDSTIAPGSLTEVWPESVSIAIDGAVTVTFTDAVTGNIILTRAPLLNKQVVTPSTGMNYLTFAASSPYMFYSVYELDPSDGTTLLEVDVASIEYDSSTQEVTIGYEVAAAASVAEIYYLEASYVANVISVTDTTATSENWVTTSPEITVWGISHEGIYLDEEGRGGHVTHIDTYKTTSEERLVCGLGGNIFSAQTQAEVGVDYILPTLYMRGSGRLADDALAAPLFQPTGSVVERTRGVVIDASIADNGAVVTAATYVSSGVVDYTLSFTSKTGAIAIGGCISTFDYLTVEGLAFGAHTGNWAIVSVQSDSATETVIRVSNPNIINAKKDETGALGRCYINTNPIVMTATAQFIVGDHVLSSVTESVVPVVSIDDDEVYILSDETLAFPAGVVLYIERTTSVIPLRTDVQAASVTGLVRGDMLSITDLERLVRVVNVFTAADTNVTITVADGVGTATFVAEHGLNVGQQVAFYQGSQSEFDGTVTIASIPSLETFTFETTATANGTAIVVGYCIQVDEELTVSDGPTGIGVAPAARWIPIESPATDYDLPPETYVRYFTNNTYSNQPILRSTMVRDTMYFTNLDDEVMKFDGQSIYRAGLVKWQPALFTQLNSTASLVSDVSSAAYTAKSQTAKYFKVALGAPFIIGDRIEDDGDGAIYTIVDIVSNATETFIYVDRAIVEAGATGTISQVAVYKYYARLNAVDRNNNITASAVTDSNDLILEFAAAKQPRLRFVGMPAFDNYDYDRIELELCRTKANGTVFYLASRQLVNFDNQLGYIDVFDGTPDSVLKDLDNVNTALMGAELGTGWEGPIRARYVTSVDNRLILSNLKSFPEMTILFNLLPESVTADDDSFEDTSLFIRRDNTDAIAAPDNVDAFEYVCVVSGGANDYTVNTITDVAGAATITLSAGLAEDVDKGSWVYMYHSTVANDNDLTYAGWYQVAADAITTDTVLTLSAPFVASSNEVNKLIIVTGNTKAVPVLLGTDGNYVAKDSNSTGSYEGITVKRLSNAINASMRMVDVTIVGQEDFAPFIAAYAGNDYPLGVLKLSKPFIDGVTPEVEVTLGATPAVDVYVNNLAIASGDATSMQVLLFPSRMLRSYKNFPEMFDNPTAQQAEFSTSVVNVNEADGQALTGAYPFFGDSAFGAASLGQVVVPFKERSIYVYNVETDQPPQKLDSRGLGCTAPFSIAPTKDGLNFATESGIYRLGKDLSIAYVGKMLQGLWRTSTDKSALQEFTGHQYAVGRKYKLSYASTGPFNDNVYVYDYDTEGSGQEYGGWTTYTNHPATGWANMGQDAFFGTTGGNVFSIRRLNEASDYRDDDESVAEQVILLRPEDFDAPGARKIVGSIISQLDLEVTDIDELTLEVASNLQNEFGPAGDVSVSKTLHQSIIYRSSLSKRRAVYLQARYTHIGKDKAIVLSVVSYRVSGLSEKGIREAASLNE